MKEMAIIQESSISQSDPGLISSFDYEAIEAPTKALLHQAARFLYFKAGRGIITIDGKDYTIIPNTLVCISPWKITQIRQVDAPLQFNKLIFDFNYLNFVLNGVEGNSENGSELLTFLSVEPILYLDSVQTAQVDGIMDILRTELGVSSIRHFYKENPISQILVTSKLVELIIFYRRFILAHRGKPEKTDTSPEKWSVLSYLYAHSSEKLTLGQVAEAFYVSQSALSKEISEKTGSSFLPLLNQIRVEKSIDYLIYTDIQLNEIAPLVGFVDASHLSKHFVDVTGVSPISYRKSYRSTNTVVSRSDKAYAFSIISYLNTCYANEDLTADRVASQFGTSVRKLNETLIRFCGRNFDSLLNMIRINKACELLNSTEYLILDIAFEVGYHNIKTFNLNFNKFKSMTPTQYRKTVTLQKRDGSET